MKKMYFLAAGLVYFAGSFAQVTEKNIPLHANIVADINFGKLTQLMTIEEWNKSDAGKELLKFAGEKTGKNIESIADLGVQLNGHAYFYHTENDSIRYLSLVLPVTDSKRISALFSNKNIINDADNSWMIIDEDSSGMQIWNHRQLLFVKGMIKDDYFKKPIVAENHGLSVNKPYNFDFLDSVVTISDAESPVIIDAPMPVDEANPDSSWVINADSIVQPVEPDTGWSYDIDYLKNLQIKKEIVYKATLAQIKDWFYNINIHSINENEKYIKTKNSDAVVSFWMDEPSLFYNSLFAGFFGNYGLGGNDFNELMPPSEFRYTSLDAHLILNEKVAQIITHFDMTDEMADLQKKITNRKINPAFKKYINMDSVMAYMSYSINTKAYLDLLPQWAESAYGRYFPNQREEIGLGGELISLLIDEEAISKMFPGDLLVLFNGLFEKEVTYTDYVFDEDYNYKPVEKKKMETLPKFLMMMSSEQNKFTTRLIKYGIHKKVITPKADYYVLNIPESPMQMYLMYKNDILFIGNEETTLDQISNNTFKAKLNSTEKNQIFKNNIGSALIKPATIFNAINDTGIPATQGLTDLSNILKTMGNIRIVATPSGNNQIQSTMTMEVPEGNSNALTYFINTITSLSKNK